MWRACMDILPTRTKLFDKGFLHSFLCKWCEVEPETSLHVLWQCEFAQKVWKACPISILSSCSDNLSFRDFTALCIDVIDTTQTAILFTTAWEVWNARNRFQWENKTSVVDDVWRKAAGMATDFLAVGLRAQESVNVSVVPIANRWRPLDQSNFKLNVGLCVDKGSKSVGMGFVIRDAQCLVMAVL